MKITTLVMTLIMVTISGYCLLVQGDVLTAIYYLLVANFIKE